MLIADDEITDKGRLIIMQKNWRIRHLEEMLEGKGVNTENKMLSALKRKSRTKMRREAFLKEAGIYGFYSGKY